MSSERPKRRLIFRWTELKGLTSIILFFMLALFVEYIIAYFFLSAGLMDDHLVSQDVRIPGTAFSFAITLSPIFHLMPLGVIVVLVSSWTYLTKYAAVMPRGVSAPKKVREPRRRLAVTKRARFTGVRRLWKRLSRGFGGVSRRVKAAVRRIRGVSYISQRLFFAKATIKGAVTVIVVFVITVFASSLLVYPSAIHLRVVGFYRATPWFHEFVLNTIETAQAIGRALPPVGWAFSGINRALHAGAPGFRGALEGLGASLSEPLAELDVAWKYLICQNVAAWVSAVAALGYGQYASRLDRRYRRE